MIEGRAGNSAYKKMRNLSRNPPVSEPGRPPDTRKDDVRVARSLRQLPAAFWSLATLSITLLVLVVVAWRLFDLTSPARPASSVPIIPNSTIAGRSPAQPAPGSLAAAQALRPTLAPAPPVNAARAEANLPRPSVTSLADARATSPPEPTAKPANVPIDATASQIGALASSTLADQTWRDLSRAMPRLFSGKTEAVQAVSYNGHTLYRSLVAGRGR
jgi:hypothetical protein